MKKTILVLVLLVLLAVVFGVWRFYASHRVDEQHIYFCNKNGKIEIFYGSSIEIIKSVKLSYDDDILLLDIRVAIGKSNKKYYIGVDDKVSHIKVGKKVFNVQDIKECYTGKTIP